MPEAARLHDAVSHTDATAGFLTGAVAGAAAAFGAEALVGTAVAAGAVSGGVGFVLVMGLGALACWGLPKLGAMAGRQIQRPAEGEVLATSPNIVINGLPAARTLDPVSCHSGEMVAQGSQTVIFNGQLAARAGDRTTGGGVIVTFSPDVIIGGPTGTVAPIDDIPAWAEWTAAAIMVLPGLARLAAGAIGEAAGAFTRATESGAGLAGEGAAGGSAAAGEAAAAEERAAAAAGEDTAAGGRADESTETAPREGEPVNPATGAVFSEHLDFDLPGPLPLRFARVWTSTSTIRGELGFGWHHSLDMAILERPNGRLAVRLADGRMAMFDRPLGAGPAGNVKERLQLWLVDGRYQVTDDRAHAWLFGDPAPDGVRRLVQIADANGNAIMLGRDAAGGLDRITDSAGRTLTVRRDTQGRITTILGPHPAQDGQQAVLAAYAYDAAGDLVVTQDGNGDGFAFGYERHLIVSIRWPAGLVFHFRYDDPARRRAARCIETGGEGGLFRRLLSYDDAAQTTAVTDGLGATRIYEWNSLGRVVAFTDGLGRRRTVRYDRWAHVLAETRADGATRTRRYDGFGRVVAATGFDGGTTAYRYAPARADGLVTALPIEVRAPDGGVSRYGFDERANLVAATPAGGGEVRFLRDPRGLLLAVQDRLGTRQRFAWTAQGLLAVEASAQAARVQFTHDALGRLTATQRAGEAPVRYARDGVGRVVEVVRADGSRVRLSYDEEGQVTSHTNPRGQVTRWDYGGLPYPRRRIAADGTVRAYHYDDDLRLVGLTNAKGERYSLAYDAAGQLVEEIGFDERRQAYDYDAAGFLAAQRDEEGRGAVFRRDAAGRLLERRFADGTRNRYAYDPAGRMVLAENEARRVAFDYGPDGSLAAEHQGSQVLRHETDARGRRTGSVLPDGRRLRVDWNGDDTVAAVAFGGAAVARYTRDALGREIARHGGGLTVASDYDPQGRLIRQVAHGRAREPVLGRRYSYDAADQVGAIEDLLSGRRAYRYDAQDRLVAVAGDDPETFVIDPAGNILAGAGEAPGAAVGDRLLLRGDRKFDYDRCGNRVRETRGAGGGVVLDYAYGADNQLLAVTERSRLGTRETRFAYDALGRRVEKRSRWTPPAPANDGAASAPESHATFLWDGNVLLAEGAAADPLATVYLHEPGTFRPLAQIRRAPGGDAIYRYHLDLVGTPQELTNDDGRVVWRGRLRAWGALAAEPVAEVPQPLRFQGQYADTETGLHYNRFRYYAPAEGCYVHQDPIRLAGGINLASYVDDPTQYVDPSGLAWNIAGANARYPGIGVTPNGGPTFSGSPYMYPAGEGQSSAVTIKMQGSRSADFTQAYNQSGISRADAAGYTWHHVDNLNPSTGETTMELVQTPVHQATAGHSGSVKQFENASGTEYGSPEAKAYSQNQGWKANSCKG